MIMSYFETWVGDSMTSVVGDPLFTGLLILAFFGMISIVGQTRLDGKLAILLPACILAMAFIPFLRVLFILFCSGILYLGISRFINR